MRGSLLTSLLGVALAFGAPHAAAENLADILALAQDNDPTLRAARAQQRASQEVLPQARALYLPSASVDGEYRFRSQEVVKSDFAAPGTNVFRDKNYGVTLRQTLLNLESFQAWRQAGVTFQRADLVWQQVQQAFLLRVAEAYFGVLAAIDDLDFSRAEKAAIARQLEQARQRFEVGLIAITDVDEAKARYDLAVAQEIAAENQLATARESLREITGQLHRDLLGLGTEAPLLPPTPANIEDWTKAAGQQNLDLAIARRDLEAAKIGISRQRAIRYPVVDLAGRYEFIDAGGVFATETRNAAIAVDLSWTPFQGGAFASQIRQARAEHDSAQWTEERVEREVLRQTRDAYLGVLTGISLVKALKQAVISNQSALRATEAGFEVGTRTSVDVLNAQRELYRARRDYAQARYDYILNTLRLKRAVGVLSAEDLKQINTWLQ